MAHEHSHHHHHHRSKHGHEHRHKSKHSNEKGGKDDTPKVAEKEKGAVVKNDAQPKPPVAAAPWSDPILDPEGGRFSYRARKRPDGQWEYMIGGASAAGVSAFPSPGYLPASTPAPYLSYTTYPAPVTLSPYPSTSTYRAMESALPPQQQQQQQQEIRAPPPPRVEAAKDGNGKAPANTKVRIKAEPEIDARPAHGRGSGGKKSGGSGHRHHHHHHHHHHDHRSRGDRRDEDRGNDGRHYDKPYESKDRAHQGVEKVSQWLHRGY
ncbi:hypothetical protein F4778DRAFT_775591 [Xylariomycetidae sp. FL2044]|nr:hypothetical protein F4778DRAFT_775591 [Xylariomycetidae sp. FL2044]